MNSIRTLAFAALVYGGSIAATAITPAKADAQVYNSYYSTPYYGGYYNYNYGISPVGYYSNYNYAVPNYYTGYSGYYPGYTNWGGNTTPSGYPQWYVNYVRANRPYYNTGYYGRGRRW